MRYHFRLRHDPKPLPITVEAPSVHVAVHLALESAEVACLLLGKAPPTERDLRLVLAPLPLHPGKRRKAA